MWLKKAGSFIVSKFQSVKTSATALIVAAVVSVTTFAQAQTPVPVDIPSIDYPGIATSLLTALTPALVAAIGLGLSIWGISFIYRKFKSMGRG